MVSWYDIDVLPLSWINLVDDGQVLAWGFNEDYQLGTGDRENKNATTLIPHLSSIEKVVGGYKHSVALTTNGQLIGFGSNIFSQLGATDTDSNEDENNKNNNNNNNNSNDNNNKDADDKINWERYDWCIYWELCTTFIWIKQIYIIIM